MAELENISLTLSLAGTLLSMAFFIISFIAQQKTRSQPAPQPAVSKPSAPQPAALKTAVPKPAVSKPSAPKPAATTRSDRSRPIAPQPGSAQGNPAWRLAALAMVIATILLISTAIVSRAIQTGHGPFSNMYEFALSFAWGIVVAGFLFGWRYRTDSILNMALFIALLLLIFARVKYAAPNPLVPALQQSTLLSIHVASAVVAYGTLTIGFGAAILYLVQNRRAVRWLPELAILDSISYRAVVIGFPFLTLVILLGALWADIAWSRYWGWDPKETASLVTWLIYAAYIHARVMRGWRGARAALLLIIGFAAILLTFFGNYIFSGLHAY